MEMSVKFMSLLLLVILALQQANGGKLTLKQICKYRCVRGRGGILCNCNAHHFAGKRSDAASLHTPLHSTAQSILSLVKEIEPTHKEERLLNSPTSNDIGSHTSDSYSEDRDDRGHLTKEEKLDILSANDHPNRDSWTYYSGSNEDIEVMPEELDRKVLDNFVTSLKRTAADLSKVFDNSQNGEENDNDIVANASSEGDKSSASKLDQLIDLMLDNDLEESDLVDNDLQDSLLLKHSHLASTSEEDQKIPSKFKHQKTRKIHHNEHINGDNIQKLKRILDKAWYFR